MSDTYVLDAAGEPVPEPDTLAWGRWYQRAGEARRVAFSSVGGVDVSTVFLAMDHGYGDGPPVLWETMAFGAAMEGEQERYTSRAEALAGHARFVERARWLDRCRLDGTPAKEGTGAA